MKFPPAGAQELSLDLLGKSSDGEILYEAETPIVFTLESAAGRLLVYVAKEDVEGSWRVMAPIGTDSLDRLKAGALPLRDALTSSWMWLGKVVGEDLQGLWRVTPANLTNLYLPKPGIPLLPRHMPVLTARAIGGPIKVGSVPASVIAYVANAARRAVKTLFDYSFDIKPAGRPSDASRELYDLPVLRLGFASFEIDFGSPDILFPNETYEEPVELLVKGLKWAAQDGEMPLEVETPEEKTVLLNAVLQLTPPGGAIEKMEIGGVWVGQKPIRLTRDSRKKVRKELKLLDSEELEFRSGRIGRMDHDRLSFQLRDGEEQEETVVFPEHLRDDVHDMFAEQGLVGVIGVVRGSRFYANIVRRFGPKDP